MFTKKDLVECVCRELEKRRQNYPKWVAERRMSQATATKQIEMMHVIYRILLYSDDKVIAEFQE